MAISGKVKIFGNSVKIVSRVGRCARAIVIRCSRKEGMGCKCSVASRLRLTCTVAIRGSRKDRCPTIVVPLLPKPGLLCGEGLLCATIAQTGGYLAVMKDRLAFRRVVRGGDRRKEFADLSRQVGRF